MVYSNDEADKSVRQRNYMVSVYLLPIALVTLICGAVYWATLNNYLDKKETMYAFVMSLTPAMFLYAYNRRHWLKMPDGTHHKLRGISPAPKVNFNEPAVYEAEYFFARKDQLMTILSGVALIAISIWLGLKGSKAIVVPIVTNLAGLFMAWSGIKGFLDKTAQLKIAGNGLWTNKLGFVNWDDINYADVVEDKTGKSPQEFLEIRLKGTKFEQANQPDERLLLFDLKDTATVGVIIHNAIENYNSKRK